MCSFESNPRPSYVFWTFQDKQLDNSNDNVIVSNTNDSFLTKTRTTILLTDVTEDDLGEYTCHAVNNQDTTSRTIRVSLARVFSEPLDVGLVVGVTVAVVFALGNLCLGLYFLLRSKKNCKVKSNDSNDDVDDINNTYAILDTSNSLPGMRKEGSSNINWTNPLPKPPRTGAYDIGTVINSATLDRNTNINIQGIVPTDRDRFMSHYVSSQYLGPPGLPHHDHVHAVGDAPHLDHLELMHLIPHNRPGSRASIGTASTLVSSHTQDPLSQSFNVPQLNRTQTHPPQYRPGYVTLPRRPRSRPLTPSSLTPSSSIPLDHLGPRSSGDGSSFHNIVQSPGVDKFILPLPQQLQIIKHNSSFNNNNSDVANQEEDYVAILNKSGDNQDPYNETISDSLTNISIARSEDSTPSRPILDTIPEQD